MELHLNGFYNILGKNLELSYEFMRLYAYLCYMLDLLHCGYYVCYVWAAWHLNWRSIKHLNWRSISYCTLSYWKYMSLYESLPCCQQRAVLLFCSSVMCCAHIGYSSVGALSPHIVLKGLHAGTLLTQSPANRFVPLGPTHTRLGQLEGSYLSYYIPLRTV